MHLTAWVLCSFVLQQTKAPTNQNYPIDGCKITPNSQQCLRCIINTHLRKKALPSWKCLIIQTLQIVQKKRGE